MPCFLGGVALGEDLFPLDSHGGFEFAFSNRKNTLDGRHHASPGMYKLCKYDKLPITRCRISSINCMFMMNLPNRWKDSWFFPGAIQSTNEHTTSFLLILPLLKSLDLFFGSLVKEISPLQAESYFLKPLMWEDSDWDLFWWQPTAQLTQTTYSDPPRVSTFSPWVCFWWWRDSSFTPLEDSGNQPRKSSSRCGLRFVHFHRLGKPLKSSQKPSCPPKKGYLPTFPTVDGSEIRLTTRDIFKP